MSYFLGQSSSASGTVSGPVSSTDRGIPTWNGTDALTLRDNSGTKIDSSGNLTSTASLRVGAAGRTVTPSFANNAGFIFLGNNSSSNDAIVIGNHASSFSGDSFIGFCRNSDGGLTGLRLPAGGTNFWFGDWAGTAIWETNAGLRKLGVQCGTATGSGAGSGYYAYVGGNLKVVGAATGNVGTGVDTLQLYSVAANALARNGEYVRLRAWGTFANNANTKQVWLYFGATSVTSGAAAYQNSNWYMEMTYIRTSSTSGLYLGKFETTDALGGNTFVSGTGSETTTSAIPALCAGEGTNNNDIVHNVLMVDWFPAGL